jgi:hypothetical protein
MVRAYKHANPYDHSGCWNLKTSKIRPENLVEKKKFKKATTTSKFIIEQRNVIAVFTWQCLRISEDTAIFFKQSDSFSLFICCWHDKLRLPLSSGF